MEKSVAKVKEILKYKFKKKSLLEKALTHASYIGSPWYECFEFVDDVALNIAITKYLFLNNTDTGLGLLTDLHSMNLCSTRLAYVTIRHGLYRFLYRRPSNTFMLNENVSKFATKIESKGSECSHYYHVKASKVLADIVESITAIVYIDCDFNLGIVKSKDVMNLLKPLVDMETLDKHPVTMLRAL
ncbi:hypothetical protein QJS04_geneDACA009291 [Acorus gramineus]|uniref:RNase III domain-containing protein n=1 Tax=Acorus gramineus TaxID=55184 RepID=A0AAV9A2I9_ACOGR|nr:hypothetical protein QJS04_geneDACA009291 [Acorus gramineus]